VPRAETRSVNGGRLQTTVPVVPDAPIGHFKLNIFGGKTGYLVNTRDNCKHPPAITVAYVAQNGKAVTQKVSTKTACGKKTRREKRHARH
jgi:hypothetical protein